VYNRETGRMKPVRPEKLKVEKCIFFVFHLEASGKHRGCREKNT
jgi:hypothetical protein